MKVVFSNGRLPTIIPHHDPFLQTGKRFSFFPNICYNAFSFRSLLVNSLLSFSPKANLVCCNNFNLFAFDAKHTSALPQIHAVKCAKKILVKISFLPRASTFSLPSLFNL